jgi:hypothetical protein
LPPVKRMNQPQCDRILDYLMSLPVVGEFVPEDSDDMPEKVAS